MSNKSTRRPASMIESLENRTLLSGSLATHTTLKVEPSSLGQPITFDVTVRAAEAQDSPTGTVNIIDHGTTVETITLAATTSTNAKFALSSGTATLAQPAGQGDYSIGSHHITAQYVPGGTLRKSSASANIRIKAPIYTVKQTDGLKIATVSAGTGTPVANGQTADVLYTGYLAKNGKIFDDSDAHVTDTSDGSFSFQVGGGTAIQGFEEGVLGMQAGETRVLSIPWKIGFGAVADGSIPPKSNVIFLITLESFS